LAIPAAITSPFTDTGVVAGIQRRLSQLKRTSVLAITIPLSPPTTVVIAISITVAITIAVVVTIAVVITIVIPIAIVIAVPVVITVAAVSVRVLSVIAMLKRYLIVAPV